MTEVFIEPALAPRGRATQKLITPQHVWEAYYVGALSSEIAANRRRFVVARDERGKGESMGATYDTRRVIDVRELVYPGGNGGAREPLGKWVYMVSLSGESVTWLAEAYVGVDGRWDIGAAGDPRRRPGRKSPRGFEVPAGCRADLGFFVSPCRLTTRGMRHIEAHARQTCVVVVRPYRTGLSGEDGAELVAVPDPFAWSEDAHEQYFVPALEDWNSELTSPERQAQRFVARVLKGVIDGGDGPGISNNLRSADAPAKWLHAQDQEEARRADAASLAHAYLACWVDSPWHQAVEASAQEAGGSALAQVYLHYAVICDRVLTTPPGIALARTLCTQTDRFPRTHVFVNQHPPDGEGAWRESHQWLDDVTHGRSDKDGFDVTRRVVKVAAQTLFADLVPSMIHQTGKALLETELRAWFRENDVAARGGMSAVIHKNVVTGKAPLAGVSPANAIEAQRYKNVYRILELEFNATREETRVTRAGERFRALDRKVTELRSRVPIGVRRFTKSFVGDVSLMFVAVNFAWSLSQFVADRDSGKTPKWTVGPFGILQVSSDLLTRVIKPGLELSTASAGFAKEEGLLGPGALGFAKGFGGAASFVTGTIEILDRGNKAIAEGWERGNPWAANANITAALCAVASSVLGVGILLEVLTAGTTAAVFGGWGGPVGAAIGGVLGVGGAAAVIVASLAARNPFEDFAERCFLGSSRASPSSPAIERIAPWWATRSIGAVDHVQEARVVRELLTNFAAQLVKMVGGTSLWVHPGLLPEEAQLHVLLDFHYRDVGHKRTHLFIDLATDEVVIRGDALQSASPFSMTRDEEGRLTFISVRVDHPDSMAWPTGACCVQLRWGRQTTPAYFDWLDVSASDGRWLSSLSAGTVVSLKGDEIHGHVSKSATAGKDRNLDE
ncbi:MAG: hypothetical protein IPF99_28795 [Deltaproteobacteria bacterium]|nr:hypothetical protein [Deltaproteobacteria bacterium]